MKTNKPYLMALLLVLWSIAGFAQTNNAAAIIKEGVKLHDAGKYDDAVAKYREALKLEPDNGTALYELSYTLYTQKKGDEAKPYLEKIINSPQHGGGAYDLMGNIYDDDKQPEKAIEIYKKGIATDPEYQRLHFNLGIAYLRQQKYAEAIEPLSMALKLNPQHASSHRMYAIAAQQTGNETDAIMAYCNFLMLEPQSARSAPAFESVQRMIRSKVTKTGDKSINITVKSRKDEDPDRGALDMMLGLSAASSSLEKNQGKSEPEILSDQLKSIFLIAGELSAKKKNKTFFWSFYADYFYKLAKSPVMPAFTRLISLTGYKDENLKWFKENDKAITELDSWVKLNSREPLK